MPSNVTEVGREFRSQGADSVVGERGPGRGVTMHRDYSMEHRGAITLLRWVSDHLGRASQDTWSTQAY